MGLAQTKNGRPNRRLHKATVGATTYDVYSPIHIVECAIQAKHNVGRCKLWSGLHGRESSAP